MSFLINTVAAWNLGLSLFKKRYWHWDFPDSYLKVLTARFLKRKKSIVIRKKGLLLEESFVIKKYG